MKSQELYHNILAALTNEEALKHFQLEDVNGDGYHEHLYVCPSYALCIVMYPDTDELELDIVYPSELSNHRYSALIGKFDLLFHSPRRSYHQYPNFVALVKQLDEWANLDAIPTPDFTPIKKLEKTITAHVAFKAFHLEDVDSETLCDNVYLTQDFALCIDYATETYSPCQIAVVYRNQRMSGLHLWSNLLSRYDLKFPSFENYPQIYALAKELDARHKEAQEVARMAGGVAKRRPRLIRTVS